MLYIDTLLLIVLAVFFITSVATFEKESLMYKKKLFYFYTILKGMIFTIAIFYCFLIFNKIIA